MSDLWKNIAALLHTAWQYIGNIVNGALEKVIPIIPTMNKIMPDLCPTTIYKGHGINPAPCYNVQDANLDIAVISICRYFLGVGVGMFVLSSVCAVFIRVRIRCSKRKTKSLKIAILCAVIGLVIVLFAIMLGNWVAGVIPCLQNYCDG
jgi:RsiW-degrading membrane proteinase PrsW (M82 family)